MSGGGQDVPLVPVRHAMRRGSSAGPTVTSGERDEVREPLLPGDSALVAGPSKEGRSQNSRHGDGELRSPISRYPQPGPALQPSSSLFPPHTARPSRSPSPTQPPLPAFVLQLGLSPSAVSFISRNTGLLLVASAQIFFVFMGLTAKFFVSTTSISTLTLILVRMSITAFGSLTWLFISRDPNPILGPPEGGVRRLLMWRGFFGFGGLFANYQSLRGLSLSDSVTIQFLAPNLTALLGFLVLGETMGWREVVAGISCLGGVVLVSRPPFIFGTSTLGSGENGSTGPGPGDESIVIPEEGADAGITHGDRMIAVAWAFAAVCSATCAYITIRKIGKQAHAMHSMLYFCYSCIIACLVGLVLQPRSFVSLKTWKEFWLIIAIGVFGFVAQMLLTFGLQREKAGRAALAMYLSLLYSLIFELVLFGTIPPFLSLLGAAIIIVSAVWVAVTKPADNKGSTQRQADEESLSLSFSRSPSPSASPAPPIDRGDHGEYDTYANASQDDGSTLKQGNGNPMYASVQTDEPENQDKVQPPESIGLRPVPLWNQGEQRRAVSPGRLPRRRSGGSGRSGMSSE